MTADSAQELTPTQIADALQRGDLEVAYQPCFDLRTGALVAVEALSRIRDARTGELIGPDRFLPVAEEAGLVGRLDDLVLHEATRQVAAWRRLPGAEGLCLALNVSVVGLDDPGLLERFRRRTAEAGLPTDALIVELTETVLSRAGRGHEEVVAGLSELGCNVTLDDFGTGNASFEYLQRFKVAGIKVDRSFVQFLGSGGRGERMAESLIRFCLSLGVLVVAEGVEHPRQLAALRRLGCPFVQGFLLGVPMDRDQIERRLRGQVDAPFEVTGGSGADSGRVSSLRPRDREPGQKEGRGVTILLAILLMLLLIGLPAYAINARGASEDRLLRAAQARLEAVDTLAASRVDTEIDGLTGVITAFSRSRPVREALEVRSDAALDDALTTMAALGPDIFSSSIYDADGRMLAVKPAAPELVGTTFAYRDYFTGATDAQRAYVSEAFQLATEDRPWTIAVSAAVRDASGALAGVVVATLSLERMHADLRDVLDQHGATATLTDSRTRILASPTGEIGAPATDARLLLERSDQADDPTADGAELWAVRPVPAVGGWLLAVQDHDAAANADGGSGGPGAGAVALLGVAGLAVLVLWLGTDRRRRRLGGEVARAREQLAAILDATPAPIVVSDADDLIVLANPAFAALVEVDRSSLAGQPLSGWLPARTQGPGEGPTSVVTTLGDVRTVEVHTQALPEEEGLLLLHTLADVTPHRLEHDRLRAQGRRDPLTGAGNRVALQEALGAAVAHATAAYAVVMLDLDGFKGVNDDLGHAVGDQLLCLVADTLAAAMGPNDLVARPGGDEFVVLLRLDQPGQGRGMADLLRSQVLTVLHAHPGLGGTEVGVSLGVAEVGEDGGDPATLLQVADQRMYRAKRARR